MSVERNELMLCIDTLKSLEVCKTEPPERYDSSQTPVPPLNAIPTNKMYFSLMLQATELSRDPQRP